MSIASARLLPLASAAGNVLDRTCQCVCVSHKTRNLTTVDRDIKFLGISINQSIILFEFGSQLSWINKQ